jgi:hypothetical protein
MTKMVCAVASLAAIGAFFASREAPGQAGKEKDYVKLIRQLHEQAASDKLVKEFLKDGTPALDALLNDFARSTFAKEVRAKLDKNFNIGQAFEKDAYASNVVKVAEAFGTAGYDRLVKRMNPKVAKAFRLENKKDLAERAIGPLLTLEIIRGMKTKEEQARAVRWVDRYVDLEALKRSLAQQKVSFVDPFVVELTAVYLLAKAEDAVWDFFFGLVDPQHLERGRAGLQRELLSPSVRAKLKQLDPSK